MQDDSFFAALHPLNPLGVLKLVPPVPPHQHAKEIFK